VVVAELALGGAVVVVAELALGGAVVVVAELALDGAVVVVAELAARERDRSCSRPPALIDRPTLRHAASPHPSALSASCGSAGPTLARE
jgi:hypothetical protein